MCMNAIRIGDVPLEWFTGIGDVRSHDKACNKLTSMDILCPPVKIKNKPNGAKYRNARSLAIRKGCTATIAVSIIDGASCLLDGVMYPNQIKGYKIVRYV